MQIDVDNVQTLEQYLLNLGALSIYTTRLFELQSIAVKRGILNDDEIENAKTIQWEIKRLLTTINDQINMVSDRANAEWPELLKQVTKCIPKDDKPIIKPLSKKHKNKNK